jgi:hypothetical protein
MHLVRADRIAPSAATCFANPVKLAPSSRLSLGKCAATIGSIAKIGQWPGFSCGSWRSSPGGRVDCCHSKQRLTWRLRWCLGIGKSPDPLLLMWIVTFWKGQGPGLLSLGVGRTAPSGR